MNTPQNQMEQFAERINPRKFNYSPKLAALVGAIIGHDYGVRDRKGGQLTSLSITSDGFLIASSTAHDSGAFVGDAADLDRNLALWKTDLSAKDIAQFDKLYAERVQDWRGPSYSGQANYHNTSHYDALAVDAWENEGGMVYPADGPAQTLGTAPLDADAEPAYQEEAAQTV